MPTAPLSAPTRRLGERALEALGVAVGLEREAGELDAERRRLGVDAVRAPDADGVDVLARALGERDDELARAGDDDLAGRAELQGERGVEHVGRRQAVVDPAPAGPGALLQHVDEGRDVVVGDALALLHGLDGERRGADRLRGRRRRPVHLLAGGDLDAPPGLHARLVGPERADLGAGVAVDHAPDRLSRAASPATAARAAPAGRSSSKVAKMRADGAPRTAWNDDPAGDVAARRCRCSRERSPRRISAATPTTTPNVISRHAERPPPRALDDLRAAAHRRPPAPRPSSDGGLGGEVPADGEPDAGDDQQEQAGERRRPRRATGRRATRREHAAWRPRSAPPTSSAPPRGRGAWTTHHVQRR